MMDLQSSHKTGIVADQAGASRRVLRRLPGYAACVGLGLLGGAVGVALAIGLAILIQLRLPPPAVFAPGLIPLMVMATLAGLGVSWLMGQAAGYGWPRPAGDSPQQATQVILVSSVFTSLAQVLLFFM